MNQRRRGTGAADGGASGRRLGRWMRRAFLALAVLLLVAVVAWLLLAPDAEREPLRVVVDDPDVAVTLADTVVVAPAAGSADGAPTVVFYPGAGVPPAAYVATWAPVVERTGATVFIPSMPLGLALFDADAAAELRDRTDGTGEWWIGGHSLGGAMAASHAADTLDRWDGLVLWGSYPADERLAGADDLEVVSVSGANDGLTTPEDIADSVDALPADTDFVELGGVNHAQFGAYGDQARDLPAEVDDATARQLIADATAAALAD